MSVVEAAALLVAIATFLTSVSGLVVAVRSRRAVADVHELVNGQSDRLLSLTQSRAFEAGTAYGRRISDQR